MCVELTAHFFTMYFFVFFLNTIHILQRNAQAFSQEGKRACIPLYSDFDARGWGSHPGVECEMNVKFGEVKMKNSKLLSLLLASTALISGNALADEAADPSAIKFGALIETGATVNRASPINGNNFGQLTTDKSDQVLLNQAALTLNRDLDPKAEGFDWGFKVQGFYGSDARYTHFIGVFDHLTTDRDQFDLVESNVLLHAPVLTDGGVDVKAGAYSTPIGYEVIQSNLNPLYSHSYIFNFGIPLKNTGVVTTTHVNDTLDLIISTDTGINTTADRRGTVNGHFLNGLAGFGLNNLADGKLTVLTLSHFGPAQAEIRKDQTGGEVDGAHQGRYIADSVITYKATDTLTYVTELNFIRDDYGWGSLNTHGTSHGADAGGVAQYVQYQVNDVASLVVRGEYFSDPTGYFVGGFSGNNDFVAYERGASVNGSTVTPLAPANGTDYVALTIGTPLKIPGLPERLDGTLIRPEVRYDYSTKGHAFDYGSNGVATSGHQLTIGVDLVVPVSIF